MQFADKFRRLDIDRILIPEGALLHPKDEAEFLDMAGQIGKRDGDLFVFVQVVQIECLKVADQHIAGQFGVFQAGEIIQRLLFGFYPVAANAFLLGQQHAFPEQIDKSAFVAQLLYRLFKGGDPAHGHAENFKKIPVEKLRLAFFIAMPRPLSGEAGGAGSDLVP